MAAMCVEKCVAANGTRGDMAAACFRHKFAADIFYADMSAGDSGQMSATVDIPSSDISALRQKRFAAGEIVSADVANARGNIEGIILGNRQFDRDPEPPSGKVSAGGAKKRDVALERMRMQRETLQQPFSVFCRRIGFQMNVIVEARRIVSVDDYAAKIGLQAKMVAVMGCDTTGEIARRTGIHGLRSAWPRLRRVGATGRCRRWEEQTRSKEQA